MTDYATGKKRPKFVKQRGGGAQSVMTTLTLGSKPGPKKVEDEQWVKDLQMFKKQSAEELERQMKILEEHDETQKEMMEALKGVDDLQDDIDDIQKDMQYYLDKLDYVTANEDKQIEERDEKLSDAEIAAIKGEAKEKLKEMKAAALQKIRAAKEARH